MQTIEQFVYPFQARSLSLNLNVPEQFLKNRAHKYLNFTLEVKRKFVDVVSFFVLFYFFNFCLA